MLTQRQFNLLYLIPWLIVTLLLIEVAIGCDRIDLYFPQHFFGFSTRKLPFDSELQLEFAVCDSAVWFMFLPMPLWEHVISFLLQKRSLWEFPLAFKKIPCISLAPHPPEALAPAV